MLLLSSRATHSRSHPRLPLLVALPHHHHFLMDRGRKAEPRGNKLLHAAELQARQAAHERMLRNAKPSVQNSAPKGFGAVREGGVLWM